jgi:hypothetical protein
VNVASAASNNSRKAAVAVTGQPRSASRRSKTRRDRNEDSLAIILTGIVVIFLSCHFPRILLNLYELATLNKTLECREARQQQFALWTFVTISFSHLLLAFNSATNMLVYGLLSAKFRDECRQMLAGFCPAKTTGPGGRQPGTH